jgi:dihydrofolate synthase/folylpolyglutamate synthase
MAFKYFKERNVDIAVVEVGLGGRLDCTNIITPIISVITNISLDHTQLLGNSLEQIALEKGGIIKKGVPVIIGEAKPETRAVFDALAEEMEAPIYYAEDEHEIVSAEHHDEYIHYKAQHLGEFDCELTGEFQPRNMNTVVVALHRLVDMGYLADCIEEHNIRLIAEEMSNAFKNVTKITGLMARWQTVRENPRVICDTGHNPGAWEYLSQQLQNMNCQNLRIIFGMVEDKDVYNVMALLPKNATYFFTKGSTKRAFPETSLKIFGDQFGLKGECYPTVVEAYQAAMQGATSEDVIFIGGSTYVVADFLKTRI